MILGFGREMLREGFDDLESTMNFWFDGYDVMDKGGVLELYLLGILK